MKNTITAGKIFSAVSLVLILALSSCGGSSSSGDSSTTATVNTAPVLGPIGDQTVDEGGLLSFTTTATDADGNGYTFDVTGLPAGAAINSASGVFAWAPGFNEAGIYSATFTVTDDDAADPLSVSETITITVANTNRAPLLLLIGDQSVTAGALLAFTATATDADGNGYTFSVTGLPTGATIDSASGAFTWTPGFNEAGIHSATFTVTDDDATAPLGSSEIITITVNSTNTPPIADAGALQSIQTSALVTLDGSASYDMDAEPLTYSWATDLIPDTSTAALSSTTVARPTFTADLDGIYTFTLTVTDGPGATGSDTVMVTAFSINTAPTADAGPDQGVAVDTLVTLDGSASSDADGNIIGYGWSIFSLPEGSLVTLAKPDAVWPTFTPDIAGDYIFTLIVTDDGALPSVADMVAVTAYAVGLNAPPVANAGPDQNVQAAVLVTLNGSGSSDDVAVTSYLWTPVSVPVGSTAALDDGSVQMPTFTPDLPGDYIFSLTVNDGEFDSLVPDTVVITATAPADNARPMADAGPDQLITDLTPTVSLTGSGTDGDGDAITAYSWTLVSVPTTSGGVAAINISSLVTQSLTFDPDKDGGYVFSLIVSDGLEWSLADTVVVTVSYTNGNFTGPINQREMDYSDLDLSGADFTGVNALRTDFSDTILTGTNFTSANLNEADLSGATLIGTILTDTNINKTIFTGALLENLDFTTVGMVGQNDFSTATLTEVNLSGLLLNGSTFAFAVFVNVDLSGADSTDVDLTGVELSTTDITGVNWSNTTCPDGSSSADNLPEECVGTQLIPLVP